MSRNRLFAVAAFAATIVLLLLLPAGQAISQELQRVVVTNFPSVFDVRGTVDIAGPIPMTEQKTFANITVSPVKPTDTLRLVKGGVLETKGFSEIVLSLEGVVRGEVGQAGEVGAILVPDEELIQRAFTEQGAVHFALRTVAEQVNNKTPYFASRQHKEILGFHRYRVYFYNTTDKAVRVDLYAYMTP